MNIVLFIVLFPFFGFLLLSFTQGTLSRKQTSIIGVSSILIACIISFFCILSFIYHDNIVYTEKLCSWLCINEFQFHFNFFLDGLSLSMLCMITGIGFLIHMFSIWYMKNKEGYSRFLAYTNLFISSMSVLVLSDNLVFMYLGWEGVSICSYLLIGFYYKQLENNYAAFKAFILTRISDVFLIIGIFLIYQEFHTFNFEEIKFSSYFFQVNSSYHLNLIVFFILFGVIGKSAQLPFQIWLSDAMVGPTPVSALIHAATMVTAGVYLIARMHFLFFLSPYMLYMTSCIGVLTILIASFSALTQTDIKRILAYSTMSQIGYMFLSLGVQAWTAAITHLIMHAIFKALLFLASGSLIYSCNNEKNIFKLGGLRKKLPFLYLSFLIGGGSLIGFPLITAGFYSKGNILLHVLQSDHLYLFLIGLSCSFLTSIYTFRMIFVVFHGKNDISVKPVNVLEHNVPLLVLASLSTFLGIFFSPIVFNVFPISYECIDNKYIFEIFSSLLSIFGIFLSYYLWIQNTHWINSLFKLRNIKNIFNFFSKEFGFNWLYNKIFINFYLYIAKLLSSDPCDNLITLCIKTTKMFNYYLIKTNMGYIKWNVMSFILGLNCMFLIILCYFFNVL